MMTKKKETKSNTGLIVLLVCGVIAVAMIIGCVFFPNEIFGIFM